MKQLSLEELCSCRGRCTQPGQYWVGFTKHGRRAGKAAAGEVEYASWTPQGAKEH